MTRKSNSRSAPGLKLLSGSPLQILEHNLAISLFAASVAQLAGFFPNIRFRRQEAKFI